MKNNIKVERAVKNLTQGELAEQIWQVVLTVT